MKTTLFFMSFCLVVFTLSGYSLAQMGSGMMGGSGYGVGPGMIGPGSFDYSPECQKFYDETRPLRKELNDKEFEYFEMLRNPKTIEESAFKLEQEIEKLQDKIYAEAPLGCTW